MNQSLFIVLYSKLFKNNLVDATNIECFWCSATASQSLPCLLFQARSGEATFHLKLQISAQKGLDSAKNGAVLRFFVPVLFLNSVQQMRHPLCTKSSKT